MTELLLNLTWLLLAVPAYWMWRRRGQRLTPAQAVLSLACVLVLLFPVVSATDDLHAMRAEMEDSSTSKRAVRQAAGEKHSSGMSRLQGTMAAAVNAAWVFVPEMGQLEILRAPARAEAGPAIHYAGRGPPDFLFC